MNILNGIIGKAASKIIETKDTKLPLTLHNEVYVPMIPHIRRYLMGVVIRLESRLHWSEFDITGEAHGSR